MQHPNIIILSCGGTIDKMYYDRANDYRIGEPAVADILKQGRTIAPPPVSLMKKDSLDMKDADRKQVAAAVADCPAGARILITHGTDTMAETARAINEAVRDKTVVLVGAFLPAAFKHSDADFNIGFALAGALVLPSGVYVAMNGMFHPAATVSKNRLAGRFETA